LVFISSYLLLAFYKKSPGGVLTSRAFDSKKLSYLLPSGLYRRPWIFTRSASLTRLARRLRHLFIYKLKRCHHCRSGIERNFIPLSPCPEGNTLPILYH